MSIFLFNLIFYVFIYLIDCILLSLLALNAILLTSSVNTLCFSHLHLFFLYQGILYRHWRFTGQQGKGEDHLLFHSTTSTRSRTLRHLFVTLHVKWLSRIFNINACVYQTATRWDLPPYLPDCYSMKITIWLIHCWCNVCLFTWWNDIRFLLQQSDIGNWWIWSRIN